MSQIIKPSGLFHVRRHVLDPVESKMLYRGNNTIKSEMGGASIAYNVDGQGNYEAALSICLKTDHFYRKRGAGIARDRLAKKRENSPFYFSGNMEEVFEVANLTFPGAFDLATLPTPVYVTHEGVIQIRNDEDYAFDKALFMCMVDSIVDIGIVYNEWELFQCWKRSITHEAVATEQGSFGIYEVRI